MKKRTQPWTRVLHVILWSFCGFGVGCGDSVKLPKLAQATGIVTYNNQPLPHAVVTFTPAKGPIAMGYTDEDGSFTLATGTRAGAVIGSGTITVSCFEGAELGNEPDSEMEEETEEQMEKAVAELAEQAVSGAETDIAPAGSKSLIPVKYSRPRMSGLTATVSADQDKNDFRFNLVD